MTPIRFWISWQASRHPRAFLRTSHGNFYIVMNCQPSFQPFFSSYFFLMKVAHARQLHRDKRVNCLYQLPYYPAGPLRDDKWLNLVSEVPDSICCHSLVIAPTKSRFARICWILALSILFFRYTDQLWRSREERGYLEQRFPKPRIATPLQYSYAYTIRLERLHELSRPGNAIPRTQPPI